MGFARGQQKRRDRPVFFVGIARTGLLLTADDEDARYGRHDGDARHDGHCDGHYD